MVIHMTTRQQGRPWVKANWRYMDKYASISVGSPIAGQQAKQQADAARASARWAKETLAGNEWEQHKQAKLERDQATIKHEVNESIAGQLLSMSRISARAMQRRALARGIILSDTAVQDASADACLVAWRSWSAILTARRQPIFTPPVGKDAQFWQWRVWMRKLVRRVVSRSFSGNGMGQIGDCAVSLDNPDTEFKSLHQAMEFLQDNTPALKRERKLSALAGQWPQGMQDLAASLLSGNRATDKQIQYARLALSRKGRGLHLTANKPPMANVLTSLKARKRTISLRLAIRPISKVKPHGLGPIGATRKVCYSPASPVWWFRYLDRKSALSAWRHAIACRQYSLAMAIADCVV